MGTPFLVYSISRSRTAWLSKFLSYGPWQCIHELALFMRTRDDMVDFFRHTYVGAADTAAAHGYWLARYYAPALREVVVRRPVEDVVQSYLVLSRDTPFFYDEPLLRKRMEYGERMLDRIVKRPGVLEVSFSDLHTEATGKAVFEHCLQLPFDADWWRYWSPVVVQLDMAKFLTYYHEHRQDITTFKRICKADLRRLARDGALAGTA